jgi:hypothetical protein
MNLPMIPVTFSEKEKTDKEKNKMGITQNQMVAFFELQN